MKLPKLARPAESAAGGGRASSLWTYALVLATAVVLAVLASAWWTQQQGEQRLAASETRLTERTAQLLAAGMRQRIEYDAASLAQLARQPRLVEAMAKGDGERLRELAEQFLAAFPGASRLLAMPAGMSEPNLEADPPIGYALLDMMRKAEREGKAPPPEVHLPGQPAAHVNLLQPVLTDSEQVLGHLVVSFPVSYLRAALAGVAGGVALQQGGTTVLQLGGTGGPGEQRLPVGRTGWQLVYAPAQPAGAGVAPVWILPAALAAAAALLVFAAFFLLRRRLLADADGVLSMLRDLAEDRLGTAYPVSLRELRGAADSAFVEARRIQERLPVAAAGPKVAAEPRQQRQPGSRPQSTPASAPVAASIEVAELAEAPESEPPQANSKPSVGLDPVILRAYDVRGVVGQGIDAAAVHALGRAIGTEAAEAGQQQVVAARDGRLSSPELFEALVAGLIASGREVLDIGQVPTPVMNFATFHLGTGAGVMVTGSHNPPDYNGLKIVIGGRTLWGEAIQALGNRVAAEDYIAGEGSRRSVNVLPDYVDRIAGDVTLHRPLRIVVDCGNGVAGAVAPQVYRAMGCEVEELFCEVDGYFPHHHPDPTVPENLDALISLVRLQGADLGLAFDGDGDRLGVVDAKGRIIWADRQLMLFARELLPRYPGADIIFDVKCSAKLADVIREGAGVPVMWKSGHSMIKSKLAELDAPLGGEMSGHIFFKDRWYGFDDAIYAGARLLEILSMDPRGSVEVFADLPDALATPELRLDMAEGEPQRLMAELAELLARDCKGAQLTTLDGLRADFPDGWGLVRASNTQPCLVLRFEADDKAALGRIQDLFAARIRALKPDLELPF